MDNLKEYRRIICIYLTDFATNDANGQTVFDLEKDHYLVLHNEWRGNDRIYGCAMHLDIIAGQVWIQHNSTEIYIDRELIKAGIAPPDIVLGFRAPSIRQRIADALYGTKSP